MVLNGDLTPKRLENVLLSSIGASVKLVACFSEVKMACNNISFTKKELEILEISLSDIILPSFGNSVQTATNGKFVDFLTLNNAKIE